MKGDTAAKRPALYVVGADRPPVESAGGHGSPFDDLDELRRQTEAQIAEEDKKRKTRPRPERRLQRSGSEEDPFSRTWFSWLGRYQWLFPPRTRLWLVVWFRSSEGTKPVELTQRIAREALISPRKRHRYAQQLADHGMVRIERTGRSALTLVVLVQPP